MYKEGYVYWLKVIKQVATHNPPVKDITSDPYLLAKYVNLLKKVKNILLNIR